MQGPGTPGMKRWCSIWPKRRTRRCHPTTRSHLRWLIDSWTASWLERIDRDLLDGSCQAREGRRGHANATVNRTLEVVRAILRRAALDWDWIEQSAARSDVAGADTAHPLVDARGSRDRLHRSLPEHICAAMARFSLETGLRRIQRHGPAVVAGGSRRGGTAWIHAGPGQSAQGNRSTAECGGCDRDPGADRQALNARVQLSR